MAARIDADGETWVALVDRAQPHPGVRAVVFNCVSNPQRPYRVVEVSAAEIPGVDRLQELPRERLAQLFAESDPFDVTHDPSADPRHPGGHPRTPEPAGERERDRN